MKSGRTLRGLMALAVAMLSASPVAAAPVTTQAGNIIFMGGGWGTANARVLLDVPAINPANCVSPDGYVVDPADSGHQLFSAMLLSAFMARRKVELVLDGCAMQRPRIIGVNILS